MKYMLMMNVPGKAPYSMSTWPKKDVEAHLEFLRQFNRKLSESGEFVSVEGLTSAAPGPGGAPLNAHRGS
jgi:hypothetical protein